MKRLLKFFGLATQAELAAANRLVNRYEEMLHRQQCLTQLMLEKLWNVSHNGNHTPYGSVSEPNYALYYGPDYSTFGQYNANGTPPTK